ncbi:MAG: flavodoxin [Chloroflexota bacterium]
MAEKIGLFYGSSTGAGENVAQIIKQTIESSGVAEVEMAIVSSDTVKVMEKYQYLIFGCSTWNIGELQDDWDVKYAELDTVDFKGRKVALFGNGDQYGYSNSFVDAIGIIGNKIAGKGAELVGFWPSDEYEYEYSVGAFEGVFMGLPLDDDNQPEKTRQRTVNWIYWVMEQFGMPMAVPE